MGEVDGAGVCKAVRPFQEAPKEVDAGVEVADGWKLALRVNRHWAERAEAVVGGKLDGELAPKDEEVVLRGCDADCAVFALEALDFVLLGEVGGWVVLDYVATLITNGTHDRLLYSTCVLQYLPYISAFL